MAMPDHFNKTSTIRTRAHAPFHADWTWHTDSGDAAAADPRTHRQTLMRHVSVGLRRLRKHGLLLPDTVTWLTVDPQRQPTRVEGMLPLRSSAVSSIITQVTDFLDRFGESDSPLTTGVLTFHGTCRVVQPKDGSVLVPDAIWLDVHGDSDAPMLVLATGVDTWMPRNRFGEPQQELYELNAPRLTACLEEITGELACDIEPDDAQKPYLAVTSTGLDNAMFYDRKTFHYTSVPPHEAFLASVAEGSPIGQALAVVPKAKPVPGAAEAIDAWGTWLAHEVATAVDALPDIPTRSWQTTVTRPEPRTAPNVYVQHETVDTGRGNLTALDVVRRVAEALVGRCWDVTLHPSDGSNVTATATRRGCTISITAWPKVDRATLTGATPGIRLYPDRAWQRPPRVVTPETVDTGCALCYECDGWGTCPACDGRGWMSNGDRCFNCTTSIRWGACPICRGDGQLTIRDPAEFRHSYRTQPPQG